MAGALCVLAALLALRIGTPSGHGRWRRLSRNAARHVYMTSDGGLVGVRETVLPTGPPMARRAVESPTVAPALSASVAGPVADRTRRLLDGPIVPTLLRLAAPNVVVMTVQVAVTAGEAYFLGWLGADALAGVSLTFPLIMLMQTMSAGGNGRRCQRRGGARPGRRPPPRRRRAGVPCAADRDRDGGRLHRRARPRGSRAVPGHGRNRRRPGGGARLLQHRVRGGDRRLALQHAGQHRPRDRQHAPPG